MSYIAKHFVEAQQVLERLDVEQIEKMVEIIADTHQQGGRLFFLGVGGSAANASHAVNDFRKICGMEAYAPTDNVSELTARINDDGWGAAMVGWLRSSCLREDDAVFVLSVGGGDLERGVSTELVAAMDYAVELGAPVLGIVGRDGGHAARVGKAVAVVPPVDAGLVTPLAESFQAVIWHGMITHPDLAVSFAHWESLERR